MRSDQRKHLRYDFSRPVAFMLQPQTQEELYMGLTRNISSLGLCICTDCLLNEGQEIIIKTDLPFSGRSAVVRWSREIREGLYQSGFELKR